VQRRALYVALALVLLALAAFLVQSMLGLDLAPQRLRGFLRGAGVGPSALTYAASAIILACIFVPTPLLMATAGLWFGIALGLPIVLLSLTASAAIQTTIVHWIPQSSIRFGQRPWEVLASNLRSKRPWLAVIVLRLAPAVPFALSNYWLGLTMVPIRAVLSGSLIGLIPRTALYVVVGDTLGSASTSGSTWSLATIVVINVIGAVAAVIVLRRAGRVVD
jgi:uncharacterized membrane protein YdjX (TVP38/TMEM64 family)